MVLVGVIRHRLQILQVASWLVMLNDAAALSGSRRWNIGIRSAW